MCKIKILLLVGLLRAIVGSVAAAETVDDQIAKIAAAGPLGRGSAAAQRAIHDLSQQGPAVLPRLLAAMDTGNIVAANWYRAAYERIVSRELDKSNSKFPKAALKNFVQDSGHQGRPRRLALNSLDRIEPEFKAAWLPTLLDDPEFRDDAIGLALKRGDDDKLRGDQAAAKHAFELAFQHARNPDQVTAAARELEALGEKVSILQHLGFVTDWYVIGPFAAPGMSGFAASFPPENSVDLGATITTNDKKTLRWIRQSSHDPLGTIDLIPTLGPVNEAVGYAFTEIESPTDREAELRCSADDNLSVWLDGRPVFGRDMWLNGTRLDRFITPVHLKAGRNKVLVKICQGPHHRDPAVGNAWTFQLRFCTSDGAGLGLKSALSAKLSAKAASSVPSAITK